MDQGRLTKAAANYEYLRGLLYVPAGLLLIAAALANADAIPSWAFPVVVVVIGAATLPILHFYNEHYGRISPSRSQQLRTVGLLATAVATMMGGTLLLGLLDLPTNDIAIAFAAFMLITYAIGTGVRPHHVAVWGTLLVAGALPVWTGDDPGNTGLVLAGVATMIGGLLDHRLFVRTFGAPGALGA